MSPRGLDTPDSVAHALYALDPALHGFNERPCVARLHRLRTVIEGVHARVRRAERCGLEATGTFPVVKVTRAV